MPGEKYFYSRRQLNLARRLAICFRWTEALSSAIGNITYGIIDAETCKALVKIVSERIDFLKGFEVKRVSVRGRSILGFAVEGGSVEIFNKLLELGADPMARDMVCMPCNFVK